MQRQLDYSFASMGSQIRLLIGAPLLPGALAPLHAADRQRAFVLDFAARLSRFSPDSELTALNHDPRETVPASKLLRAAVNAGLWAAESTDGVVVPTLVGELERHGYDRSLDGLRPASLEEALTAAPGRRPAGPDPEARWREVVVDDAAGTIRRPPGLLLDSGGVGKGLCADAVAFRLRSYARFVVDCGGDIAVGGVGAQLAPYAVEIEHPLTGRSIGSMQVAGGGVATSGLNVRIWRDSHEGFAHHLIDAATGDPVWSGLIGATALGGSTLEAETLSKLALLVGPEGARNVLAHRGGVIVHDDGEVEAIGPVTLRIRPDRLGW
jgi:thiamine biosynthesis lipoprotein